MAEQPTEPTGPDLHAGVPLANLDEDQPLLGHVDGEAVLVVRRGGDILAIGATCTHWGGPLAEGLVVGDTVRCPWHHACFSLRTGEAVGAPALNPVARWETEVRDGTVFVTEKHEEPALAARGRSAGGPETVVVVGAGAAGSAAAEMLRREGHAGRIVLVDPDAPAPYDRPNLSKDYLAGNAPEEWIPLRPDGFWRENDIERVVAAAESLDTDERTVGLSDERELTYDALLLATGSTARRLPLPGAELSHVHTLRSLEDCRAIIAGAESAERAVVVGASFIGMEVAAALRARGLDVTVVAPESVPFESTLGPELGRVILAAHEENGVAFRLGNTPAEITDAGVRLDDDAELAADLVVVGIGVQPNVRLAESAGLAVADGIAVDEYLETDAPGVFVAGDAARWADPHTGRRMRVEHWVVAQRQGQAVARNILGQRRPFTDPPFFWTQQFDVGINYVGHAPDWDEIRIDGDPAAHDCTALYMKNGHVLATATVGRDRESLLTEARFEDAARHAVGLE